jgi:hypothetical protein
MATIAVLGCGPAGLFAAHAVKLHGFEPRIFSIKKKSFIYGAQYLHAALPELTIPAPDAVVKTTRVGRGSAYAERVYGDVNKLTSWSRVQPEQPAWDMRKTYERAWDVYEDNIIDIRLDGGDIADFSANFELVISTVPAWTICMNPMHQFKSVPIFVKQDFDIADTPGFKLPPEDNWVVYNGTKVGDWYRMSRIFGHRSLEARATPTLLHQGYELGFKIVSNTCDCHPNVVRAGRMGKWVSGELTHHAFLTALDAVSEFSGVRGSL